MKRLILAFIAAAIAFSPSVSARRALPATDTFDRDVTAASPYTASWTVTLTGVWSSCSAATCAPDHYGMTPAANGLDYGVEYNNLDSYNANQYAQVVIKKGTNGYQGVCVRADSSGNAYCITLESSYSFYKFTTGTRSLLGSGSHSWTDGHTLKLDIVSDTLTAYDNGVSFATQAGGGAIAAGSAGMIGYIDTTAKMWDWEGGNVGGGSTFPAAILASPKGGGRTR